jgi:putative transposase
MNVISLPKYPSWKGNILVSILGYIFICCYVIGWGISNTLDAFYSLNVTKEAILKYDKPKIMNLDQLSQFICNDWIEYLEKEDIKISVDEKCRAIDNSFIEKLCRSV